MFNRGVTYRPKARLDWVPGRVDGLAAPARAAKRKETREFPVKTCRLAGSEETAGSKATENVHFDRRAMRRRPLAWFWRAGRSPDGRRRGFGLPGEGRTAVGVIFGSRAELRRASARFFGVKWSADGRPRGFRLPAGARTAGGVILGCRMGHARSWRFKSAPRF